jgi:TatD DNase family protein
MLFAAIGVHPNSGTSWFPGTIDRLRGLADHPKVCAIGEIGLDYYRDRTPRVQQKQILKDQLVLAKELDLPAVLHVRNSSEEDRTCIQDLLSILEEWVEDLGTESRNRVSLPGVIHSFSGNSKERDRAVKLGFYIGITGPVTYNRADELRDVVKGLELERLLIETDGPFLAPVPFRGKRNEPAHVRYIIDKISEIKVQPPEQIASQTAENAGRLFRWE